MGNACGVLYFLLKFLSSTHCQGKSKIYIKLLRHRSLPMGLRNMYSSSQACKSHNKGDFYVQNKFVGNEYFPILSTFQHVPFSLFYH